MLELLPMANTSNPTHLTNSTYQEFLKQNPFVVADFFADWCGPCQMMLPIFDELAQGINAAKPEVVFAKINIDESAAATDEANVLSVPTFIVYKNGEEVDRHIGGASPTELQKFIESNY